MRDSISIVFAGSGGAGAITAGSMFLQAAARAGYYGLMTKLSGAQVRGGEAAALVEIGVAPLDAQPDRYDVLVALDWDNVGKFAPELPMDAASLVLADPAAGKPADAIVATGARLVEFPLSKLAADVKGRGNMVALGAAVALAGIGSGAVEQSIRALIGGKGEAAIAASLAAVAAGAEAARTIESDIALKPGHPGRRWFGSGNEAIGLGALRGGVRFVAAYPITPATEITEWLAPRMKAVGGRAMLAEDEIAAINMAVGASFGGAPSLTVTSGPGLSLKVETIGLAISAEIPLVIVDVMRVGPSTGIPTKSDQGDLDLALYGTHGDAPRIVLAPMSISDCALTAERAVHLAEALQTPVFVLSDQSLGQTQTIIDEPTQRAAPMTRVMDSDRTGADFRRYQPTPDHVSPMPAPGAEGRQWVAEGLSHDEFGHPSNAARFHVAGLNKRRDKIEGFDYGDMWGEVSGEGDTVVIAFGSSVGPVKEAARRLRESGVAIRVVGLRLLAPIPKKQIADAIVGARRVIVVEQNHTGQLYRHLLGAKALPPEAESLARPGPAPFRPGEIAAHIV
ncbi:MAG: 2-oxoacid:acceptor oxidoreductase subunit alpha [Rhodoblastus sp.]